MARYSTIIFILQILVVYHAYKNQKEFYWYLIIFLLPVVGILLYAYKHFYSMENIESVAEKVKSSVNTNYEIDKLLEKAKYADTLSNKIKLADAYATKGKYEPAIALYESCLKGFNARDIKTIEKVMVAYYFIDDYESVIRYGNQIQDDFEFQKSESIIVYAWSFHYTGNSGKAKKLFESMDHAFTNYVHRCEYVKFLIEMDLRVDAKDVHDELLYEIDGMERNELRFKREIIKEIKSLSHLI